MKRLIMRENQEFSQGDVKPRDSDKQVVFMEDSPEYR